MFGWALHRAATDLLGEALGSPTRAATAQTVTGAGQDAQRTGKATKGKGKGKDEDGEEGPSEEEVARREQIKPLLRELFEGAMKDLNDGGVGISWLNREKVRAFSNSTRSRESFRIHPSLFRRRPPRPNQNVSSRTLGMSPTHKQPSDSNRS